MSERKAWFCPSCQKHHGPHVDTCPGVAGAQPASAPPNPGTTPYWPPGEWLPTTTDEPWIPYWPVVGSAGYRPSFDPDRMVVVGVSQ